MPMPPIPDAERLRCLNALLEEALTLPEAERRAWLRGLPAERQPLVPVVLGLLARDLVETDTFMRRPLELGFDDIADADEADRPGDLVGPYRLIGELGAGGMATVWLAERTDGLLQRQVALKLPRAGWAQGLARRMAGEREILGALEHPRIARLYDAGVTPEGRPWLAMECVRGSPIDSHCRTRALGLPQRLRLFLQVAQAVAYAHARLIVHRDLKPSNILVTAEGEVRLLDFGVAKLLGEDAATSASLTQVMGRPVTPDYASPEQVAGRPVGVATDVYSLGVVLYELLTGQRPYRLGRQSAAALEEAILAADVPAASTQVRDDRAWARQLRGDLDTILAKALRKDAALRYASVESFAADIQRHLDGQPVLARPRSRRYRALKFVGRHGLVLASGTAVCVAITFGLGAALWQARQAGLEAARAEQVKRFIGSVFQQARPREGEGGVVTASELLVAAAGRIERELATDPRAAAELGVLVGDGLFALGETQRGAEPLRAAVARAEPTWGRRHPITLHGKALLIESMGYADLGSTQRLLDELIPDAEAGLPETAAAAVFARRSQAWVLAHTQQGPQARAALYRAIEIGERHLGARHRDTILAMSLLSSVQGLAGDTAEQFRWATEARLRAEAAFGAQRPHPTLLLTERRYAEALGAIGRPEDAVPVLERVLRERRALEGSDAPRSLQAMRMLALAQGRVGRIDRALPPMREAVALQARLQPQDLEGRVALSRELLALLLQARRADEALDLHRRLDTRAPVPALGREADEVASDVARTWAHALRGDAAEAERRAEEAARRAGALRGAERAEAWRAAAFNARMQGRPSQALGWIRRALDDPATSTLAPEQQAALHAEAGSAWLELGDLARGEAALRRSLALFAQGGIQPGLLTHDTSIGLARLHLKRGQAAQAEALLRPLVQQWEAAHPGSEWHGQALHWLARAQGTDAREQGRQARVWLAASRLPALRRLATG